MLFLSNSKLVIYQAKTGIKSTKTEKKKPFEKELRQPALKNVGGSRNELCMAE